MQLVGRKEMAVKMKSARFLNFFFKLPLSSTAFSFELMLRMNPLPYLKTIGRYLNEN